MARTKSTYLEIALEILKDNPGLTAQEIIDELAMKNTVTGRKRKQLPRVHSLAQLLIRSGHARSEATNRRPTSNPRVYFYKE